MYPENIMSPEDYVHNARQTYTPFPHEQDLLCVANMIKIWQFSTASISLVTPVLTKSNSELSESKSTAKVMSDDYHRNSHIWHGERYLVQSFLDAESIPKDLS